MFHDAYTKPTRHTPATPRLEQGAPGWAETPVEPKHVWAIRVRLEIAENHRDLALFNTAIDSKQRGCDLVRLQVVDVFAAGQVKERTSVLQCKTKKPIKFELTEGARKSIAQWLKDPRMIGQEFLWPGRVHEAVHI